MRMKLCNTLLVAAITIVLPVAIVQAQDQNSTEAYTVYNFTTTNDLTPTTEDLTELEPYSYVLKLSLNLDESKVPNYLINIIYNKASFFNLTSEDIIALFGFDNYTLSSVEDILTQAGAKSEKILSFDGFDAFLDVYNETFKQIYDEVTQNKFNISGLPLKKVLVSLGIDSANFSDGMSYGEPNPYEVFKQGNFSKNSINNCLTSVGKTVEDLFNAIRDAVITSALQNKPEHFVRLLNRFSISQDVSLSLWTVSNLTSEDIFNVPNLRDLVTTIKNKLNENQPLAVLTSATNITINAAAYNSIMDKDHISKLYAESLTGGLSLLVESASQTSLKNILVLRSEEYNSKHSFISIGSTNKDLKDCVLVTVQNDLLLSTDVKNVQNNKMEIVISKGNLTQIALGSPLICQNKVFGLVKQVDNETVTLDTFYIDSVTSKGFINNSFNKFILTVVVLFMTNQYLFT